MSTFDYRSDPLSTVHSTKVSPKVNYSASVNCIHAAPEPCWRPLVERMAKDRWIVDETEKQGAFMKSIKPPHGYAELFSLDQLQLRATSGADIAI